MSKPLNWVSEPENANGASKQSARNEAKQSTAERVSEVTEVSGANEWMNEASDQVAHKKRDRHVQKQALILVQFL